MDLQCKISELNDQNSHALKKTTIHSQVTLAISQLISLTVKRQTLSALRRILVVNFAWLELTYLITHSSNLT